MEQPLPLSSSALGQLALDNALPTTSAEGWLYESTVQITDMIRRSAGWSDKDRTIAMALVDNIRIYPRLLTYTYWHIRFCTGNEKYKLLAGLSELVQTWKQWDDVPTLLNHKRIRSLLWLCLRAGSDLSAHSCHEGDTLERLLSLDILGICAHAALSLQNHDVLIHSTGDEAQKLVNLLQGLLDHCPSNVKFKRVLYEALLKLSKDTGMHPEYLVLSDIDLYGKDPAMFGGHGDVWKIDMRGHSVAVKVVRSYVTSDAQKIAKAFTREAIVWAQLAHPNVLPFHGIYYLDRSLSRFGFVSPWMENGTVLHYLAHQIDVDRSSLLLDVANGLEYLHSMTPSVVHGDLKGVNILIDSTGTACIADFGLSTTEESQRLRLTTTSRRAAGTWRWLAPELLVTKPNDVPIYNTRASDIYAFGIVGYEIFTGQLPFGEIPNEAQVILMVMLGRKLSRPPVEICSQSGLNDSIWELLEACWQTDPSERPTSKQVVDMIKATTTFVGKSVSLEERDKSFLREVRANLDGHPLPLSLDRDDSATLLARVSTNLDVPRILSTIIPVHLKGHHRVSSCVAFLPDANCVVSCSKDQTARFWDLADHSSETHQFHLQHSGDLEPHAISQLEDCTQIVGLLRGVDIRGMIILDARTGLLVSGVFRSTSSASASAFSADGKLVVSGSTLEPMLLVWKAETGVKVAGPYRSTDKRSRAVLSVAFSNNARFVAMGCKGHTVCIWDLRSFNLTHGCFNDHSGPVTSIAFSPHGRRVASGSKDHTIRIWDFRLSRIGPVAVWHVATSIICYTFTSAITCVAWSFDSTRVVSGCEDGTIWILDAMTEKKISGPIFGDGSAVCSIRFSDDGEKIVSGCQSGTICVWNV